MGCFEKFISEMEAVNIVTSDRVNDLSQHVQAILWLHNCIVDEQQKGKLQEGGLLVTKSTGDGKEPKVQFVRVLPEVQSEVQTLATSMIDRILQKANVPRRQELFGDKNRAVDVSRVRNESIKWLASSRNGSEETGDHFYCQ